MKMKIMTFEEIRNTSDFLEWFLIEMMTEHAERIGRGNDRIKEIFPDVGDNKPYKMKFVVNGVEIDFDCVIKGLELNWERAILGKAEELISDMTSDMEHDLENVLKTFSNKWKKKAVRALVKRNKTI
jgi:hypothetical protein